METYSKKIRGQTLNDNEKKIKHSQESIRGGGGDTILQYKQGRLFTRDDHSGVFIEDSIDAAVTGEG